MSAPNFQELAPPLPPEEPGNELLRAAVTEGGDLVVSLVPAFDDPGAFGLLLVDIARHLARAYAAEELAPEDEVLEKIKAMWVAEWEKPTDLGETAPHKDHVQ